MPNVPAEFLPMVQRRLARTFLAIARLLSRAGHHDESNEWFLAAAKLLKEKP